LVSPHEGYGGPAQPSPTIGQCLNGGLCWLEVECNRCKTRASLPLDAIRRPRDTPIWKLEASLKCRSCRKGRSARAHDQADRDARDHALQMGSSGRGTLRTCVWVCFISDGIRLGGAPLRNIRRVVLIALSIAFALASFAAITTTSRLVRTTSRRLIERVDRSAGDGCSDLAARRR
jgi:hypothetical protein